MASTDPRRILVAGNGGRECAIATACLLSPRVEQLYVSPPNWGIVDPLPESRVRVLELAAADAAGLAAACREHRIELAIVGPEDPLCAGLADELRAAGIAVVGPGKVAARLEGSKAYAKDFMKRHGIPTGGWEEFTDAGALLARVARLDGGCVLKADGLAAGKGVMVCANREEAEAAARRLVVDREFGSSGDRVLLEELLVGKEISFTCLAAGGRVELLATSTDYKRLRDKDQGPNTGGMGNICPTPYATDEVIAEFKDTILSRFAAGIAADGLDYRGFLFIGTMLTDTGLKVLEFNVRLGDPEAEVVLPMFEADWPRVFAAMADGAMDLDGVRIRNGASVAVMVATANYPFAKSAPAAIDGFDRVRERGLLQPQATDGGMFLPPPVSIYFAGVSREPSAAGGRGTAGRNYYEDISTYRYYAAGGRVLAVSAHAEDLSRARRLAYEVAGNLHFDGMQLRGDIGKL